MSKPTKFKVNGKKYTAQVLVRVGVGDDGRGLFRAMTDNESVAVHDGQQFVVGYFNEGGRSVLLGKGQ